MRFAYASLAICLWGFFMTMTIFTTISGVDININTIIISFAIVAAGAMAGGDGD